MNAIEMEKLQSGARSGTNSKKVGNHIICPVCGGRISKEQLPDKESVIDDGMFYMIETDRIINSRVTIEHTFDHFFNEEKDCIQNDPHTLGSIIEAEFDGTGECIRFSVLKIYAVPGDQK
ncbi:MAG: hypothetical protein HXS40_07430 [Theionarchaea archaeon]|nr:hypothetical protein [Theionarchaea archaeon]